MYITRIVMSWFKIQCIFQRIQLILHIFFLFPTFSNNILKNNEGAIEQLIIANNTGKIKEY